MMDGDEIEVFVEKKKKNVITLDELKKILNALYKFIFVNENRNEVPFEKLYKLGFALLKSTYAYSAIAKDYVFFIYKLSMEDNWIRISYDKLQDVIQKYKPELSLRGFMKRLSIEYKEEIYEDYENKCKGENTKFKNPSFSKRWLLVDSPNDFFYTDVFADSIIPQNVRRVLKMSKTEFENYEKEIKSENKYTKYIEDNNIDQSLNSFLKVVFSKYKNKIVNNLEPIWDKSDMDDFEMICIKRMSKMYSDYDNILFIKQKISKLFDFDKGILFQSKDKETFLQSKSKQKK